MSTQAPTPLVATVLAMVLLAATPALADDWPTDQGQPTRTRNIPWPLESTELVRLWSLSTSGPPNGILLGDLDGDPETEVLITAAGAAKAFRTDGGAEWTSVPADLLTPTAPVDLDGDGRPELPMMGGIGGAALLRGTDGGLIWQSAPDDLSRVGRILVRDLDGDTLPDLLITEVDCGPNAHGVGRTVALTMAGGTPTELFRLAESTRDYNCSNGVGFADLDGNGQPEVVAVGTRYVYVYSSVDGSLLMKSADLGPVPYGYALPYPVDVDNDGDDELVLLSDNSYAASSNSRRALALDVLADGTLGILWQASVADVSLDRHRWPAQPLIDVNGDGIPELVHSIFEHTSAGWITYVRRLSDGLVLAETDGPIVATELRGGAALIYVADASWDRTTVYSLTGGLLLPVESVRGDTALNCSTPEFEPSGRALSRLATDALSGGIWLIDALDSAGENLAVRTVVGNYPGGLERDLFTLASGDTVVAGCATNGAMTAAVVRGDGDLEVYDGEGALHTASPVKLPDQATGSFIFALSENPPAIQFARGRATYDASNATLARSISPTLLEVSVLASGDLDGDHSPEWIALDSNATSSADVSALELDGTQLWTADGFVVSTSGQSIGWYAPWTSLDLDGDGVLEILTQTVELSSNRLTLMPISGATGSSLWPAPYVFPSSAASYPVGFVTQSGPRIAVLPSGSMHILDAHNGTVLTQLGERVSRLVVVDGPEDGGPMLVAAALLDAVWRAFDGDGSLLWRNRSIADLNPVRYWGTGLVVAGSTSRTYVAEGRLTRLAHDHNLIVLDVADGTILHTVRLENGQIVSADGSTAMVSLNAGAGLDGSSSRPPVAFFGGSDGYLYLVDLDADPLDPAYPGSMLLGAWNFGTPLGEVSAGDIDGDGFGEVLVSGRDGESMVLDRPALDTAMVVADTNCFDPADVDVVERTDLFCAAWTFTGTNPDGFVATLLDSATGARVGGRVGVTNTTVRFEGLRLSLGRAYRVEVQAYTGAGRLAKSSRAFSSDGATVIDPMQAPSIVLSTIPERFVPGQESTTITAELTDASPLSRYEYSIRRGASLIAFEEQLLNTASFLLVNEWDGLDEFGDPLPLGVYTISVLAEDFSGLSSTASVPVELIDQQAMDEEPERGESDDVTGDVGDVEDALELADDTSTDDTSVSLDLTDVKDDQVEPGEENIDDAVVLNDEWVWACLCETTRGHGVRLPPATALWFGVLFVVFTILRRNTGKHI